MNNLADLFGNPAFTGGAVSLGTGLIFLALFATGKLPTPKERLILQDQIKTLILSYEKQIDLQRASSEKEIEAVRSNLRRDLEDQQRQNTESLTYTRELVAGIMTQQDGIQATNQTLSTLVQQLPVLVYAVQELINQRKQT